MNIEEHVPNWQLVYECVKSQGGRATIREIAAYSEAHERAGSNARPDAISLSVNENTRVHYAGGRELRRTDAKHRYDLLFHDTDGSFVLYDPSRHGVWEIYERHDGTRGVRLAHEPEMTQPSEAEPADSVFNPSSEFRLESHLRDYLAQNLGLVTGLGTTLRLYAGNGDGAGIEYQTDIGRIDILAIGDNGAFYVLELKLSKGPDAAVGQTLRYMAAIRNTIAKDQPVYGVIVASTVTDRLRYAVSELQGRVFVLRYELQVSLEPVDVTLSV